MYVIYINDRPLVLRSSTPPGTRDRAPVPYDSSTHLAARYNGKPRTLLQYADMLEKGSPRVRSVELEAPDVEQLWADFRGKYKRVEAAGGVVTLAGTDRVLFIHRRGRWDLPKGKIDPGEDAPTAALREVEEETGVTQLTLGRPLLTTYHTYRNRKEKRVLKPTYWFDMTTRQEALVPQAEEDIERAEWHRVTEMLASDVNLYPNLALLLRQRSGK